MQNLLKQGLRKEPVHTGETEVGTLPAKTELNACPPVEFYYRCQETMYLG